jgi:fibronectin type 3 domain-containing protein
MSFGGFTLKNCLLLTTALVAPLLSGCAGLSGGGTGGGNTAITVPAIPLGVQATAGNAQVALRWMMSNGATSYHVKRSTTSGGPYTQIASPPATAYTDSGPTNGTKYFYVVSALNSAGESTNSAETSATPTAPVQVPSAPTGLQASAGNAQVSLTWNPSANAISYHVKRATSSGGPYSQISAPTNTSYTDAGLTNGAKYYYVVSALDSAGESPNSAEASATPVMPVTIPAAPTSLSGTAGNAQVVLNWASSTGATSYHVKRSTTSGSGYTQISAPAATTFTDTGLTNGTKYFYVVTGVNTAGESGNSNQASATPVAPAQIPAAPAGLSATAGNAQVVLSWITSAGATSYHVKRSTTTGGPYTQVATPTSASFTDTGLTNDTKYFYVVSALNNAGESPNSSEVNATPTAPVTTPAAPTGLQAAAGNAQVSLAWTASAGATTYHVKRSTTSGSGYTQIAAPTATSYTDTGLTNGTTYFYVVSALNTAGESANSSQASAIPAGAAPNVTITIDPTKTKSISPYIYGINFYSSSDGPSQVFTFDRAGGNRWTAYNWITNASNAGSDYLYESDNYLSSSNVPAEAVRTFVAGDQGNGLASLVTFQMQGYVSADESGPVATPFPNLSRFRPVVNKKSTASADPFTITPPAASTDNNVYMDEFAWTLNQKFSGMNIFGTSAAIPTFLQLDNEPELWNSTHQEIQGSTGVTSDNYISKTIALTKAIKDQFPNVLIFGPVHYGFEGIYSWQGDPSLSPTPTGNNWFPDKYLPAIKSASTTYGKSLVDVYDFHWYSEATDGTTRVTDLTSATLTAAQVQAIVQSPRSLWDATYTENSWITQDVLGGPIYILSRLQSKIAAENPGMKISVTEYNNGGSQHIAGTIAQADNLGVFGNQGVFAASLWPLNNNEPYILAGFRAFRDFDGASSNFGDTSLQATSSNVGNVVVYASTDSSNPSRVVFVAINRSTSAQVTAINGQTLSGTAHMYQMTATSASGQTTITPVSIGTVAASGSSLTVTLPALSVTTIDIH